MKKTFFIACLAAGLASGLFAQVLPAGAPVPAADGVLSTNEYPLSQSGNNMTLGMAVSPDGKTLYFALEAKTTGWVSVGLGSLRMNGAYIVIANDDKGKTTVSEETGKGHAHKANAERKLLASAVKEDSGETTLEFAVPAEGIVTGGSVKLMIAYGKSDSLSSMHSKYSSYEIPVSISK
jgi:hypothetical protein